jgi:hypothetical protein
VLFCEVLKCCCSECLECVWKVLKCGSVSEMFFEGVEVLRYW